MMTAKDMLNIRKGSRSGFQWGALYRLAERWDLATLRSLLAQGRYMMPLAFITCPPLYPEKSDVPWDMFKHYLRQHIPHELQAKFDAQLDTEHTVTSYPARDDEWLLYDPSSDQHTLENNRHTLEFRGRWDILISTTLKYEILSSVGAFRLYTSITLEDCELDIEQINRKDPDFLKDTSAFELSALRDYDCDVPMISTGRGEPRVTVRYKPYVSFRFLREDEPIKVLSILELVEAGRHYKKNV